MAHSLSQGCGSGAADAPVAGAATSTETPAGDPMQAQVRILGTRLGRFVEFEFALYGGDLAVELILPTRAFEEFCQRRGAAVSALDAETSDAIEQMAWRAGHPGLLQRTVAAAVQDE
ncbi:phenol hydroxylase subunit [Xanthobacter sp. 126]|uniref:phenol hydroxylase subunit n=1 Tax=Xanthobacter sp. 126 TaxID=1131814 RepID=UPI0012DCA674|nr:phenol hydroxylase subunit [Xanthobacter sp. 126]